MTEAAAPPPRKALNPTVKFVLELGPLALFFVANSRPGLFHGLVGGLLPADFPPDKAGMLTATAVLIPVTFAALIISFALTRRLPVMPVVTAGMVLVFGALTLWLQDKTFIEIKLTVIYCLFGIALLGSMAFGKLLLPIVLDTAIHLDAAGLAPIDGALGTVLLRARGRERSSAPRAELGPVGRV